MSESMIQIFNNHIPECGDPPIVTNKDPKIYVGYFKNCFGDQFIYTCNRTTGEGELRCGDTGWNKAFPVVDGRAGLIMNDPEERWLRACWEESTAALRVSPKT